MEKNEDVSPILELLEYEINLQTMEVFLYSNSET